MMEPRQRVEPSSRLADAIEAGHIQWSRATLAAALALIYPASLGGIRLHAGAGPVRQAWLAAFRDMDPSSSPPTSVPASVTPDRLQAQIAATQSLVSGEVSTLPGLLETARGSSLIVNMAERQDLRVCALIAAELDRAAGTPEQAVCTVLLDEGLTGEDAPPAALTDRLAFDVDLNTTPIGALTPVEITSDQIADARQSVRTVEASDEVVEALVQASSALGVSSIRAPLFCLGAAKAIAALDGRKTIDMSDAAAACALVLAGRVAPPAEEAQAPPEPSGAPEAERPEDQGESKDEADGLDMAERLIEAVEALPGAALHRPSHRHIGRKASGPSGRSGDVALADDRGRPDRSTRRRGRGGKIDIPATLRAATPLQPLRRQSTPGSGLVVKPSDLRMKRFRRRKQSSVIFVVDASGSSALQRMSEAKGAVLHLLAECYARRDLVSLIAFRGRDAELLLAPTRSLVAARRRLLDLPGGGGTPLPRAIASALTLADAETARGRSPFIVFLSDGRGNVALNGSADRGAATEEATLLARRLAGQGTPCLFFDTSKRPDPRAKALSDALGASYAVLPVADSASVSRTVQREISSPH